jgi:predicted DNA-binding transcriptional regulator AlpA
LEKAMPEIAGKKQRLEIPDYLLEERVLDIPVAAEVAGLSYWSMWHAIKAGKGPPVVRLCGRKQGVRVKDLKAWIASRLTTAEQVTS